ncbi:MAG TPA: hypothetical protein VGI52_05110, partial [Solirubrobacteraceae bacterium]
EDVTERVLAAALELGAQGAPPQVAARIPDDVSESAVGDATGPALAARPVRQPASTAEAADLLADSLGLQVLALLDEGAVAPAQVWRLAQERLGDQGGQPSAGESLVLAAQAVASLLKRGLIVLRGNEDDAGPIDAQQQGAVLAAIETWAHGGPQQVVIARKS